MQRPNLNIGRHGPQPCWTAQNRTPRRPAAPRLLNTDFRASRGQGMHWQTHEISNQFDELQNYNLYATDAPLREAMERAGASWAGEELAAYGSALGAAQTWRWAEDANKYKPEFDAFDARG